MKLLRNRFFDVASLLIFQGILAQDPAIQQVGQAAVTELLSLGFLPPAQEETIRIYPRDDKLPSSHAGSWRPGIIYLRIDPKSQYAVTNYLRHELYHEFSNRTCSSTLPRWAKEAGAMHFSGESTEAAGPISPGAIDRLRKNVALDAQFDELDYQTLQQLVANLGWPDAPCAKNTQIENMLASRDELQKLPLSFEVISLLTGRVLAKRGDVDTIAPAGSLLKLSLAAALKHDKPEELQQALAESDSDWFLNHLPDLDFYQFENLSSNPSWRQFVADVKRARIDSTVRIAVGERNQRREFPLMLSLHDLSWLMRNSILSLDAAVRRFGSRAVVGRGTLMGASEEFRALRDQLHALVKTGTASTIEGTPLVGHLVVAWPEDAPSFLGVFRQGGLRGASLAGVAADILSATRADIELRGQPVNVQLRRYDLHKFSKDHGLAGDDCSRREVGVGLWSSACGYWKLWTTTRAEFVPGLLFATDGNLRLRLDAESYADGVLRGEADTLQGAPRAALRAVALWNGIHGQHRHGERAGVCDTSHCMVYAGTLGRVRPSREEVQKSLIRVLDQSIGPSQETWLQFSQGGDSTWSQSIAESQMSNLFHEPLVLELKRHRQRDGAVEIEIEYVENREIVSCELFRKTLRLPSCPERIMHDSQKKRWTFTGMGSGHGSGLNVGTLFKAMGGNGTARDILQAAYTDPAKIAAPR